MTFERFSDMTSFLLILDFTNIVNSSFFGYMVVMFSNGDTLNTPKFK